MKHHKRWLVSSAVVIFLLFSCDNTLDPLDRNNGTYAIYGFLNLEEDIHYIRVRDLHAPFTKEATQTLDATASLHNLTLGTSTLLESDSKEHRDVFQHNFIYRDSVYTEHSYKLSIERSDGVVVEHITKTPTIPEPVVEPVNQHCYVPIEFSLGPLNGGTVVLRMGLGPEKDSKWGPPQILKPDESDPTGTITYSFTPYELLFVILDAFNSHLLCADFLNTGHAYISYIHYSEGFYEKLAADDFDIIPSTMQFGSLYYDTLSVPVDTRPVCPQDC